MRLPAIFRTTATRLTALYLLLFMACAFVLVFYMTSLSVRMLTSQTRDTIESEVAGLNEVYQSSGLVGLVREVDRKARQPGASLFLIADSSGRVLAGNVEALEPGVLDNPGWTARPFAYQRYGEANERRGGRDRDSHRALAQVYSMPNGLIVLVGRDLGEPERLRNVVRRALVLALSMMALGGFLIWFFVGRRALKRIDAVSAASARIMGGDLAGRLPVSGAGDEFDRLSVSLNAMLGRIGELNDSLKQVADNISHDLKTPITRLRNRAEQALAGEHTQDEYKAVLEATIAEADQLIRTFNAILRISRLEAGNALDEMAALNLAEVARDVCELYEPLAEDAGVALSCDGLADMTVRANRELVSQALSNMVDNAIKYSPVEGRAPAVAVSLSRRDGEIRLAVCDNGSGVPDQDRARVTERFVRLEQSRSQPGSGLGLSMAKAVAKFHGGRLDLTPNNPGLCATLVFAATGGERHG